MSNSRLQLWTLASLLLALAGVLLSYQQLRIAGNRFLPGYLPACLFWVQIAVGSLAVMMIHNLTGGDWGELIRPGLKAAAATLPLAALLLVPLGMDLGAVYPWVSPEGAVADSMRSKPAYLTPAWFQTREIGIFLSWMVLAAGLRVWSDRTPRLQRSAVSHRIGWNAFGLIVYGISVTVFGIDWVMSLEPRWSSTNFGFLLMAGPLLGASAFAVVFSSLTTCGTTPGHPRCGHAASVHRDLGNLLLAGVLLWSYLEFQQYLAIWYENLPDRVIWYLARTGGGWQRITGLMAACYAVLPVALLLFRRVKSSPTWLGGVAALVLVGNLLNTYWSVIPSYRTHTTDQVRLDAAIWLATAGFWLAAFLWLFGRCQTVDEEARR